jgi:hypothetical protein
MPNSLPMIKEKGVLPTGVSDSLIFILFILKIAKK